MREAVPAPQGGPEAFLRAMGSGPRGFFGTSQGWVAHAGAAAAVHVDPGDAPDGSAQDLRFREAEQVRERLAEMAAGVPGEAVPGPRVYGGFAFRPEHRASGAWEGFPSAAFTLPRFELHGGAAAEPLLVGQMLLPEDRAGDEAARALREDLLAVQARLEAGGGGTGFGGADAGEAEAGFANGADGAPGHGSGKAGEAIVRRLEEGVDRRRWERAVEEVLDAIRRGEISKAVLARVLDLLPGHPDGAPEAVDVLERLRTANPGAWIYLWEPQAGRALVGAAPETLASVRNGRFRATAVAGSAPVGHDAGESRLRAEELRASEKDRMEHACTLADMRSRLADRVTELWTDPEPRVLTLPRIQHLETRIEGVAAAGESVLSFLEDLHPTPAVCGLPRDRALDLLARKEPFQRGWYAGPVGWMDGDGDGVFVPALRSAVGGPSGWRLFAGAGVVEGSDPTKEWEETAMKFQPMLRALGVDPGR